MDSLELKNKTAKSLKWNVIDRFATQLLYAITGIVLARELTQEDFGLVGAILVFQAFATLFVDSGFSSALIQRKNPTQLDYSTVLWFNVAIATAIYVILFFSAPLIADCFDGDTRLIPLSRVMFLSFILNAAGIVQTNRLMKQMNVRPIAATNAAGLASGAIIGIYLAINGYGAWAIVWQTIASNGIKTLLLWIISRWMPLFKFSLSSLKSFFAVGSGIMATTFLNVFFQNIYSFFIGNRIGLAPLGYYTQADKWSKMGIASLAQAFGSAFLPTLSSVQYEKERFTRITAKINRFTSYIMFPCIALLIATATPIFHALFGTKWDASIILFQILLVRGIFTIITGLYNNYLLSLAKAGIIVYMEILRDVAALAALFLTWPYMTITTADDTVFGIKIMLYGQLAASALTWFVTLVVTAPKTGHKPVNYIIHMLPYAVISLIVAIVISYWQYCIHNPWLLIPVQITTGAISYFLINLILKSKIQLEVAEYVFHKNIH